MPSPLSSRVVRSPTEDATATSEPLTPNIEPLTPNAEPLTPSESASFATSDAMDDPSSARSTEDPPVVVRRNLSADTTEERLLTANTALTLVFDVLDSMDIRGVVPEEVIFQSIMDVCSRCGNTAKAVQVTNYFTLSPPTIPVKRRSLVCLCYTTVG